MRKELYTNVYSRDLTSQNTAEALIQLLLYSNAIYETRAHNLYLPLKTGSNVLISALVTLRACMLSLLPESDAILFSLSSVCHQHGLQLRLYYVIMTKKIGLYLRSQLILFSILFIEFITSVLKRRTFYKVTIFIGLRCFFFFSSFFKFLTSAFSSSVVSLLFYLFYHFFFSISIRIRME